MLYLNVYYNKNLVVKIVYGTLTSLEVGYILLDNFYRALKKL